MFSFVAATRFWGKEAADLQKLQSFIESARISGAKSVLVAVNQDEDRSGAADADLGDGVQVFPVTPWGYFVIPLNSLLIVGRDFWEQSNLLLASAEVTITPDAVELLSSLLDEKTLVVGAALEGHLYSQGVHQNAGGRMVPWNTLALWNPSLLWRTGVPLIGDGPINDPDNKGVEEVVTIAVQQQLWPETLSKLVRVPGIGWNTSGFDSDRLAKHERKMGSKDTRPAAQIASLGIPNPSVIHV